MKSKKEVSIIDIFGPREIKGSNRWRHVNLAAMYKIGKNGKLIVDETSIHVSLLKNIGFI